MNKQKVTRWAIYLIGLLTLAVGLSLTTQVALGVSPIISVAYTISNLLNLSFGDATFIWYCIFVLVEIIIHIYRKKYRTIVMDLLQIPLSLVFTRFLNIFKDMIPNFATDLSGSFLGSMAGRIIFLFVAIVLTGIGAALSLDMRLVPNPGDGIVQAIADVIGKTVGFTKNCVDVSCVVISCALGYAFAGQVFGINVGTIFCMILVGRVIAFINKRFLKKLLELGGVVV